MAFSTLKSENKIRFDHFCAVIILQYAVHYLNNWKSLHLARFYNNDLMVKWVKIVVNEASLQL